MIESISGPRSAMILNMLRVQNNASKLSVPVKPYVARYAQFKHFIGVPSSEGSGGGVSLAKLRVLDNLIEKLAGKSGQASSFLNVSGQEADKLLARLQQEYQLKKQSEAPAGYGPGPEAGILLNKLA